jgi:hypothetical protein
MQQLLAFLYNPLVALVFGLFLGALALSGKLSVPLANVLLLLTCGIGSFGIVNAGLKDLRLIAASILGLVIVGLLLSYYIKPDVPILATSAGALATKPQPPEPFKIETGLTFLNFSRSLEPSDSGNFWVTYVSSYGNTASPVALAMYADITNMLDVDETIKSYWKYILTSADGYR